ncbi:MAG: hypothetical protein WA840_03820 [Caulobacteraceae bacterium]
MTETCSCQCGRVMAVVTGKPILHAVCYCTSCRIAGLALATAPGAPSVVGSDGGTDLVLFRKDRVGRFKGGELLQEHRLTPASPTRRVVATCCNAPMFLDFTKGHWLSLYGDRLSGNLPPLDARIMTVDRVDQTALLEDVPSYPAHAPRLILKLLAAWAAMGFHRPKVAW